MPAGFRGDMEQASSPARGAHVNGSAASAAQWADANTTAGRKPSRNHAIDANDEYLPVTASVSRNGQMTFAPARRETTPPRPAGLGPGQQPQPTHRVRGNLGRVQSAIPPPPSHSDAPGVDVVAAVAQGRGSLRDVSSTLARWRLQRSAASTPDARPSSTMAQDVLFTPGRKRLLQQHTKLQGPPGASDGHFTGGHEPLSMYAGAQEAKASFIDDSSAVLRRSAWGLTAARVVGDDDAGAGAGAPDDERRTGFLLAQEALRLNPSLQRRAGGGGSSRAAGGWTVPRGSAWMPFLQAAAAGGGGSSTMSGRWGAPAPSSGKHIAYDVLATAAVLKAALLLAASAEFAATSVEHGSKHASRVVGAALLHFWSNACALLVLAVDRAADPAGVLPPRGPAAVQRALAATGLGADELPGAGDALAADAVAGYVAQLWLGGITPVPDVAVVAAAGVQLPSGGEGSPRLRPFLAACSRLHSVVSAVLTCMGPQLFRALPSGPRLAWFVQGAGLKPAPAAPLDMDTTPLVQPSGQQGSAQHAILAVLSRMSVVLLQAQAARAAPLRRLAPRGGGSGALPHPSAPLLALPLHELRIQQLEEGMIEGSLEALDALLAGSAPFSADPGAAVRGGGVEDALPPPPAAARMDSTPSEGGMSAFTDRESVVAPAGVADPPPAGGVPRSSLLPQPKAKPAEADTADRRKGGTVAERIRSRQASQRRGSGRAPRVVAGRGAARQRGRGGRSPVPQREGEGKAASRESLGDSGAERPAQRPPRAERHPRGGAGAVSTPVRPARASTGPSTPLEDPEASPELGGSTSLMRGALSQSGSVQTLQRTASAQGGAHSSLPHSSLLLLWSSACRWWVQGGAQDAHPFDSALVRSDDALRAGLDAILGDAREDVVSAATRGVLAGGDILHPGLPLAVTPLGWRLVTSMLAVTLKYTHTSVAATCFRRWASAAGGGGRRGDAAAAGAAVAQRSRQRHLPPWLHRWVQLSRAIRFARCSAKRRMFRLWAAAAAASRADAAAELYGANVWRVRSLGDALLAWRRRVKVARRERFLTSMARGHARAALQRRAFGGWAQWAPAHRHERDLADAAAWHMTFWSAKRALHSWRAGAKQSAGTRLLLNAAPYLSASMAVRRWRHAVQSRHALERLTANVRPIAAARLAQRHLWAWAAHIQHLKRTSAAVTHHANSLLARGMTGLRRFAETSRANRQHSVQLRAVLRRLLLRRALARWVHKDSEVRLAAMADDQRALLLLRHGIAALRQHRHASKADADRAQKADQLYASTAAARVLGRWRHAAAARAKRRSAVAFAKLVLRARCWTALRRNMLAARERREKRRVAVRHASLQRMRRAFAGLRRMHDAVAVQHAAEDAATSYNHMVCRRRVFAAWAALAAAGSRRRNAAEAAHLSRIITWTAACFDAWRERTDAVVAVRVANQRRAAARAVRGWLAATIRRRMGRDAAEVAAAHADATCMQRVWTAWQRQVEDTRAETELGAVMAAWHLRRTATRALRAWRDVTLAAAAAQDDARSITADSLDGSLPELPAGSTRTFLESHGDLPQRHAERPVLGTASAMLQQLHSARQAAQLRAQAAQVAAPAPPTLPPARGVRFHAPHQRQPQREHVAAAARPPLALPTRPRSVSPVDSLNGDLARIDAEIAHQQAQLHQDVAAAPPKRAAVRPRSQHAQPPTGDMLLPPARVPAAQRPQHGVHASTMAFVAAHLGGGAVASPAAPASPLPPLGSPQAPLTVHKGTAAPGSAGGSWEEQLPPTDSSASWGVGGEGWAVHAPRGGGAGARSGGGGCGGEEGMAGGYEMQG